MDSNVGDSIREPHVALHECDYRFALHHSVSFRWQWLALFLREWLRPQSQQVWSLLCGAEPIDTVLLGGFGKFDPIKKALATQKARQVLLAASMAEEIQELEPIRSVDDATYRRQGEFLPPPAA
jgi:hypothetical protein